MIALVVFTDGRKDCITKTIQSAQNHLIGPISEFWIHDDSADPEYRRWLEETFVGYTVISGGARRGFGGAIQNAWTHLLEHSAASLVFHLEDDFTFNKAIPLDSLMWTLFGHTQLSQMALRRQPWNTAERAAGGVVELNPDAYEEFAGFRGSWLRHNLFFTTNPSLYWFSLMERGWPDGPNSEGEFSRRLLADGMDSGYWGARDSGEWVTHIGDERVGTGY